MGSTAISLSELNWSVNKPFNYFPNRSCQFQTACYTSTVWRCKNIWKNHNDCRTQMEDTWHQVFLCPSLPSWLAVWYAAWPTSALPCLHQLCYRCCRCTLPCDRRDGAEPSFAVLHLSAQAELHARLDITHELREELWTFYRVPLFPHSSIPCTIFDFKAFLRHLKCNLWVFNQEK